MNIFVKKVFNLSKLNYRKINKNCKTLILRYEIERVFLLFFFDYLLNIVLSRF